MPPRDGPFDFTSPACLNHVKRQHLADPGGLVEPAVALLDLGEDFPQGAPERQRPVADGQHPGRVIAGAAGPVELGADQRVAGPQVVRAGGELGPLGELAARAVSGKIRSQAAAFSATCWTWGFVRIFMASPRVTAAFLHSRPFASPRTLAYSTWPDGRAILRARAETTKGMFTAENIAALLTFR